MDKIFKLIEIGDNPIRADKNMLELQKTMIYYGDKISIGLENFSERFLNELEKISNKSEKPKVIEKGKEVIQIDRDRNQKSFVNQDHLREHLKRLENRLKHHEYK